MTSCAVPWLPRLTWCIAPLFFRFARMSFGRCEWRPVPRFLPPGREYYLVRREAVTLGTCEPQPTDPRRTQCVRGLTICLEHPDCRASLALALRSS